MARASLFSVSLLAILIALEVTFPQGIALAGPSYYMREELDGSVSFTDNPPRYSDWDVFINGRSRSGSRFRDYLQNFYLYDAEIRSLSALHGVPAALIKAVTMAESAFNPDALSPSGAQGLMQIIPSTARYLGVSDPWDAKENLSGGTRYLKELLKRFDGSTRLAVAAYNAGPRAVERAKGIPNFRETQGYVKRVEDLYAQFRRNDLALDQH